MRALADLSATEILALAISNEEEDGRILADFAHGLREVYPDTARVLDDMARQEADHRRWLIDLFTARFGSHIPLVRREHVRGNPVRKPVWQVRVRGVEAIRSYVAEMERDAERFYRQAAARTTDAEVRRLLGDLADAESGHATFADGVRDRHLASGGAEHEDEQARRTFVLRVIQPGLVGLMDGSVSTLAPVFAAAFATREPWNAFLVGVAASLGAGISMGFAEALADDGKLSGRARRCSAAPSAAS